VRKISESTFLTELWPSFMIALTGCRRLVKLNKIYYKKGGVLELILRPK